MAVLNDVWHSAVIDFGCASSRMLWIKFSRVKVLALMKFGEETTSEESRLGKSRLR